MGDFENLKSGDNAVINTSNNNDNVPMIIQSQWFFNRLPNQDWAARLGVTDDSRTTDSG